jgi:hypothetical protein
MTKKLGEKIINGQANKPNILNIRISERSSRLFKHCYPKMGQLKTLFQNCSIVAPELLHNGQLWDNFEATKPKK